MENFTFLRVRGSISGPCVMRERLCSALIIIDGLFRALIYSRATSIRELTIVLNGKNRTNQFLYKNVAMITKYTYKRIDVKIFIGHFRMKTVFWHFIFLPISLTNLYCTFEFYVISPSFLFKKTGSRIIKFSPFLMIPFRLFK